MILGVLLLACTNESPSLTDDLAEIINATSWEGPLDAKYGTDVALSSAGDQVLVTAPERLDASSSNAWLVPSDDGGGKVHERATAWFVGTGSGWGYTAVLDDVDGDDADDVLLMGSALNNLSFSGDSGAYLFAGPHEGEYTSYDLDNLWSHSSNFTYANAASVGDVDGDGDHDLLMYFRPNPTGDVSGVAVFQGPVTEVNKIHDYLLTRPGDDALGWNFETAQLDDDPELEVLAMAVAVAQVWALDAGPDNVEVASHGRMLHQAPDPLGTEYAGQSLASGAFTDHTGPSVSVGSPGWGERGGRIDLYEMDGVEGTWVAGISASQPGRFFANAQCMADFNGDGVDDLAVGATGDPYGAEILPGRVYIFEGPIPPGEHVAEDLAARILRVSDHADAFGYALACDDGRIFATARYEAEGRGLFRLDDLAW